MSRRMVRPTTRPGFLYSALLLLFLLVDGYALWKVSGPAPRNEGAAAVMWLAA